MPVLMITLIIYLLYVVLGNEVLHATIMENLDILVPSAQNQIRRGRVEGLFI